MRVRESGMPPQDYWDSFFDMDKILDELLVDTSRRDVLEFGCGYGTFTLPTARRISGNVFALDLDPDMLEVTRLNAKEAGLDNIECHLRDFIVDGSGLADGSVDYAMLFNVLHVDDPVGLARSTSQDTDALILGLAGTLHERLTRGDRSDAAAKHRDGKALDLACIDFARHFAHEVWTGVFRAKEPTSQEQRRAAAIYRFALLEAYRERGISESLPDDPPQDEQDEIEK